MVNTGDAQIVKFWDNTETDTRVYNNNMANSQ